MKDLPQIEATTKTGEEKLSFKGIELKYSLLDFWRWSVSDILSNATRGRFAEFIVGASVGLRPEDLRDEWDAFDLKTNDGIKIEVKSAAFIQSWRQNDYSKILFSIKKARFWDAQNKTRLEDPKKHADVYAFCLLSCKDQKVINPLKLEQWEFYVLPTFELDNYERSQSSITLNSLKKICALVKFNGLHSAINTAHQLQTKYLDR